MSVLGEREARRCARPSHCDRTCAGASDPRPLTASLSPSPPTGTNGQTAGGLLTAAVLALFLCSSASASIGNGWRWPRTDLKHPVKVHVVVDAAFDRGMLPQLRDAARAWNTTDLRLDVAPKPVPSCDPVMAGTICVSSPDAVDAVFGPLGGWSWQTDGFDDSTRLISYARAWINTRYTSPADKAWTRRVFCHELGHNIGLGHTEDGPAPTVPSCMSNDFAYYSVGPSKDDLAFLHSLYSTVAP